MNQRTKMQQRRNARKGTTPSAKAYRCAVVHVYAFQATRQTAEVPGTSDFNKKTKIEKQANGKNIDLCMKRVLGFFCALLHNESYTVTSPVGHTAKTHTWK